MRPRTHAWLAAATALLLLLPPARQALESSMTLHMLVLAPLLMLCGALIAGALPAGSRARLDAWNAYGIAGLFATAVVLALIMIPRLLDLAVTDWRIDAAKALALVACGGALRLSWRRAGALVQGFFLGNLLPMTAAAGRLYQDSPLRLCDAYLLDDQLRLGQLLVARAVASGIAWFAQLVRALVRREAAGLPQPDSPQPLA
ncbi:MAG: hypothetical protein ACYC0T_05570 [Ramlibacter sp.]